MPKKIAQHTFQASKKAEHDFLLALPKAELHLHLEGSLEPELMLKFAKRNNVSLPYHGIEDIKQAYRFHNLQSFLDIYYQCAQVLQTQQDFFDLTWAYLLKCHEEGIVHVEPFFDPQTHTERGLDFETVITGIHQALKQGQEQLGISHGLILCFLRHLPEQAAIDCLNAAKPFQDFFIGVGLDSSELGHPPEKFTHVFKLAKELGLHRVAHAGEEGPAQYIHQALDILDAQRIDHGVRCTEDESLIKRLIHQQTPLTVCPLSNTKLNVYSHMQQHPVLKLLEQGLNITINSDDPAFFGDYLMANFQALVDELKLNRGQAAQLAANSINSSFLTQDQKQHYLKNLKTRIQLES